MIYDYELEKQFLAALLKEPQQYFEIANLVSAKDFYSKDSSLHATIFSVIKQALDASDEIDDMIVAQRISMLGVSFEDNINPSDYIRSLALRKVPAGHLIKITKELKKITIRREIYETSREIALKMKGLSPQLGYPEIIAEADNLYNAKINLYEMGDDVPENIYDEMEAIIEERGENPIKEFGLMGPHPKVNQMYGSLLRAGNITVVVARAAVGKMHPLYTKVLTPEGFKPMSEISVGSKVVCPSGRLSTVTRTFDHQNKDVYRVHLKDGRFVDCGLEHLWKVFARDNKGNFNWMVIDTSEIISHLKKKTKHVFLPLVDEISSSAQAPMDPYSVGVLLGDGCLTSGPVIESADQEIIDKVCENLHCSYSTRKTTKSKSNSFRLMSNSGRVNAVWEQIRDLGLDGLKSDQKFIPEVYFSCSFEDRLNLMKGLMDTDGTLSRCGSIEADGKKRYGALSYCSVSEKLAKDVQRLVWSLGGIARISTKVPFYYKDGEKIYGQTAYMVSIRFRNPKSFFNLKRKRDLAPDNTDYNYPNLKIKITSVEKIKEGEDCRCIEIDDVEHLYVVDNYIVTHNTQFCMDFSTKVSARYDIPVLHFDNGEMSKEELIFRQCAALSGVKMHLLETGLWRRTNQETVDKVRETWKRVKNLKFYYHNVGGMDVDNMIKVLKRFYYNKVGRGNPMIFSFDYIKTSSESKDRSEYQIVGEIVDKFKRVIQKDIVTDKKPMISMITSVQSNRLGITNNRASENIIDDESIVSMSDRIIQFASHMFILRKKTLDEIEAEGRAFGTHKLINVKARHLGEDLAGALDPVQMGDSLRQNFVNLEFNNFGITEKGDLRDIARFMDGRADLDHDGDRDLPPNL